MRVDIAEFGLSEKEQRLLAEGVRILHEKRIAELEEKNKNLILENDVLQAEAKLKADEFSAKYRELTVMLKSLRFLGWFFNRKVRTWLRDRGLIK